MPACGREGYKSRTFPRSIATRIWLNNAAWQTADQEGQQNSFEKAAILLFQIPVHMKQSLSYEANSHSNIK